MLSRNDFIELFENIKLLLGLYPAFSVSTKSDLEYIKTFLLASMHFIDTEIANYLGKSGIPTKDGIIVRNILLFLYEDFEKDFCKSQ